VAVNPSPADIPSVLFILFAIRLLFRYDSTGFSPERRTTMIRFALLSGAHTHTAGYLNLLKERESSQSQEGGETLRLVVVWDDLERRGREIAAEMGCEFCSDLDTALQRDLEAVIICADNAHHRTLVEAAAKRGLDIFCEKPMALTVEEADSMLAAIRQAGVLAVFGYVQPFDSLGLTVRKLLAEGSIGAVTYLHARNAHHAAYGRWFDRESHRWFTEPERAGGGAFLDMGTHAVHYVRTLFGPVRSVMATISNKSGVYPQVDDFGIAVLEFACGVTGVVEASWVCTAGPRGLEVIGSRGRLEAYTGVPDGERVKLIPFADNRTGDPIFCEPLAPQPSRLERLVALREGRIERAEAEADLLCCRDAVAIMQAAYESAKSGRKVDLKSDRY